MISFLSTICMIPPHTYMATKLRGKKKREREETEKKRRAEDVLKMLSTGVAVRSQLSVMQASHINIISRDILMSRTHNRTETCCF